MRKTRSVVKLNESGEVVAAFPKGYACPNNSIEEDWASEEEGYILTSLKKATSRNKGNSLERDVAKAFSMWLYGREDIMARTPLSGGWEGSKLGDITANPAKLLELKLNQPKIYVECKNREGLLSETFFNWMSTGSPKTITDWLEDTKKKAGNQIWCLVLKGRATEPWVMMPAFGFGDVEPMQSLRFYNLGFAGGFLYMFPLKQLSTVFLYNTQLKEQILG